MYVHDDPDSYELVFESQGALPYSSVGLTRRWRTPQEVFAIKAERKRREEDEILRRADEIRARRATEA